MGFISKSIKVPVTIKVGSTEIVSDVEQVSVKCGFYDNREVRIGLKNTLVIETRENSDFYTVIRQELDKQAKENDFDRRVTEIVRREMGRGAKWNLRCGECGCEKTVCYRDIHMCPNYVCPNCGGPMTVMSTKQLD